MTRAGLTALALTLAAPAAAGDLRLDHPIDCDLGADCYIQNYVDRDPGPNAQDHACGLLTYDGHKGTDFALLDHVAMDRGVDVLAAADGVVAGLRDGMPDVGLTPATAASITGRECGNGVALRHPDGWTTQYCHMKSGSIRVQKGQQIARGTVLGQVGLSGSTEFPHLHLQVRQGDRVVDPFDPKPTAACGTADSTLWRDAPPYVAGGLVLVGFAPNVPDYDIIKQGTAHTADMAPDAGGMVLFALAFGARQGDVLSMTIRGPRGIVMDEEAVLERDQAQVFRALGRRLTDTRWPAGQYQGTITMQRGEQALGQMTTTTTVPR